MDHDLFLSFSIFFSFLHSDTNQFWFFTRLHHHAEVDILIFTKISSFCQNHAKFFQMFFICQPNLALLFLSVTSGLHIVVNPLHLHSWRFLLVVNCDTYVPTSTLGCLCFTKMKIVLIIHFSCILLFCRLLFKNASYFYILYFVKFLLSRG